MAAGRMSNAGSAWDPELYARFQAERSQPSYELAGMVQRAEGMRVVDLGCGSAELRQRLRGRGMLVETTDEVMDQLGRLADVGVQEVQVQHLDFDSDDVPAFLAEEVAPRVAGL